MVVKERVEHVEAREAIDRFEDLARRARRVAIRGIVQTAKAFEKLTPDIERSRQEARHEEYGRKKPRREF